MSFFDRAGAAFGAGAPIGASVNVAQSTKTENQASRAGAVLSGNTAFLSPQVAAMEQNTAPLPTDPALRQAEVARREQAFAGTDNGSGVDGWVSWLDRHVWSPATDYVQASMRYGSDQAASGAPLSGERLTGTLNALGSAVGLAGVDQEFREDYLAPERAQSIAGQGSSIAQQQWELLSLGDRGNRVNPETGKIELPLIDDPDKYKDRMAYFSQGPQKWLTGIADATYSLVLDPTIIATGVAGKAAQAARTVKAADVTAAAAQGRGAQEAAKRAAGVVEDRVPPAGPVLDDAADVTPDVTNVADDLVDDGPGDLVETFKPKRFQKNIEKVTDYAWNKFGEVRAGKSTGAGFRSDLLNDPVLGGSAEKEALADALGWVASSYTDEATAKGLMDDFMYAAAGDRGALARIGEVNERIALDAEAMISGTQSAARDAISGSPLLSVDEKWELLNSGDDLFARQRKVIAERVAEFNDSLGRDTARVVSSGTAGTGVEGLGRMGAVADFQEIPLTAGLQRGLRVSKTMNVFRSLPPVRVLSGTHIPNTLNLADDMAVQLFDEHVRKSVGVFGNKFIGQKGRDLMARFRDDFAVARSDKDPGLSRAQRGDVVKRFNDTMQRSLAKKLARQKGWDEADVEEWIKAARNQWESEVNAMTLHMRQAVKGDDAAMVFADSSGNLWAGDRNLGRAVSTGQFAQTAPMVDWKRMDRLMRSNYKPDMTPPKGGPQATGVRGVGRAAKDVATAGMDLWTDMWKFGALFRLAYPLRVQMDTQARNLATLGPLEYGLMAMRGMGNKAANLRRVDRDMVGLYNRKFQASMELDFADEALEGFVDDAGQLVADAPVSARRAFERRAEAQRVLDLSADGWRKSVGRLRTGVSADRAAAKEELRAVEGRLKAKSLPVKDREGLVAQKQELENRLRGLGDEEARLRAQVGDLGDATATGKVRRGKSSMKKVQGSSASLNRKTGEFTRPDRLRDTYMGAQDVDRRLFGDARASIMGQFVDSQNVMEQRASHLARHESWEPMEFGTSRVTQEAWANGYTAAVNRHVRNDASMMRMARGVHDEDIVKWMRDTPDGKEYWAAAQTGKSGKTKFVDEWDLVRNQREHFDALVPNQRAADTILARDISRSDLDSWYGEGDQRPTVYANMEKALAESTAQKAAGALKRGRDKWFQVASVMPETMMGRHPQYHRFYQGHLDRLMASTGRDKFSGEQIRELRKRADGLARKDMGRIMFDTTHRSNVGQAMRWMMPFYSAWADVMVKWSRIFAKHPEAVPALMRVAESPTSAFVTVDDEGNRIMPNGDKYEVNEDGSLGAKVGSTSNINEGFMVWAMPEWVENLTGADDLRISRGSLNAIFQGEVPFLPGLGPMATVPVNSAISGTLPFTGEWGDKIGPELADDLGIDLPGDRRIDLMTWIQPFGQTHEAAWQQAAPSWMGNLVEAIQQDSPRFNAVYHQLMETQINKESLGLTEQLGSEERARLVNRRARNWWLLRFVGNQVPASTTPRSELEWYFQEYRQYQDEYGIEASDRFMEDYPDYFEATISMSLNTTGIQANIESHREAQKWRKQIGANPDVGWALVGMEAQGGEFSDAVYTSQMVNPIDPAQGNTTWRTKREKGDSQETILVRKGWSEWSQVQHAITNKLEEMGVSSIQSAEAAELRMVRDEFLTDLKSRNPVWGQEYDQGGETGANPVAPFLNSMATAFASNPGEVENRQDLRLLDEYMQVREVVREKMLEGGYRSTGTSETSEFRQTELYAVWSEYVEGLKRQSVAFGDMYARAGLERDNLAHDITVDDGGK